MPILSEISMIAFKKGNFEKLKNIWALIKRRYLFSIIVTVLVVGWFSGLLTGWMVVSGGVGTFPSIDGKTRLLVIAPHPDDEVLVAGGLIQRVLKNGGQVKVIYLTNGDGSRETVITENKKIDLNPAEFITLGEKRMQEAINADRVLGLLTGDDIFLGFPDQGLSKMYYGHYDSVDGPAISLHYKGKSRSIRWGL